MLKKQYYVSTPTYQELNRIAQVKGRPVAEVVRTFIEEGIQRTSDIDYSGRSALQKLVDLKFKEGPKDLSSNLDHYLYGGPKK